MTNKTIPEHQLKRLEKLSTFLRELRYTQGMSQMEVSKLVNLHRNSIVRAENAENITLISIFELADALDICPKELFMDIE